MAVKWSLRFIDIEPAVSEGRVPEDFISASDAGPSHVWKVLSAPIDEGDHWVTVMSGDAIRIPLHPYVTEDRDPAIAVALAFQLGVQAVLSSGLNYVSKAHMAVGVPVEEIDNYVSCKAGKNKSTKVDCFRFWLGFAMRT